MAINTATIQHRRGSLEDFNPDKMVPGELAFTTDGSRKVFAAFAPGDYKELISSEEIQEDLNEAKEEVQVKLDEALEEVDEKISNSSDKANVIEIEKSGETITATDSSNAKFRGMNVCGKSKQYSTTGKNLFDVSQIIANNNLSISGEKITITTSANSSTVSAGKTLKQLCPSLEVGVSCIITFETTGSNKYVYLDTAKTVWNIGQTITITQDMLNSTLQLYASGVSTTATITNMMIRDASITDATYEKYTGGKASPSLEYPQAIENCENTKVSILGKNLLPYPYYETTKTASGVIYTDMGNGGIGLSGTAENYTEFILYNGKPYSGITTFALLGTFNNILGEISLSDKSNDILFTNSSVFNSYTINFDEYPTCASVLVKIKRHLNNTNVSGMVYPMIVSGNIAPTEYEAYKGKQSLTIPNTLCGIPVSSGGNYTDDKGQEWVCDEIDMERGVYVQRIKEDIINGSEEWMLFSVDGLNQFYTRKANVKHIIDEKLILSPCYISGTSATRHYNYGTIYTGTDSDISCICINTNEYTDVYEWKARLIEKPVTIYYVLVTPVETALTAEQIAAYKSLHSNYPTTTILTNNGAGMMVKYGADTKLYIDNKFAELAAQLV